MTKPLAHVLAFRYRGDIWKAQWHGDHKRAIMRQYQDDDFEIVWASGTQSADPPLRAWRYAEDIMQHWRWPKRLEIAAAEANLGTDTNQPGEIT